MGEAPEAIVLVESPEDVDRLQVADPRKLAYLTQTTLSVDDANRIIDRLRARFPTIANPPKDDICYATQNRQEAVKLLSREADVVLVLGSQNSSNSQRLAELSVENGVPAYLIDGAADIHVDWFRGNETVLITAGASAPELVVEDCIEFLKKRFGAQVETRTVREEEVHFPLPKELRGRWRKAQASEVAQEGGRESFSVNPHTVRTVVGRKRLPTPFALPTSTPDPLLRP